MSDTMRIRGPQDMIAAVPYLLGFAPESSLVMIGLHDGSLIVTTRTDLDDAGIPDTLAAMKRGGANSLVALVYSNACAPQMAASLPWSARVTEILTLAAVAGIEVLESILVCDGRYWSYHCTDPSCCPPEGNAISDDGRIAAELVFAGVNPLASREELGAALEPVGDTSVLEPLLEQAADGLTARLTELGRPGESVKREMFPAARDQQPQLSDEQVARFGVELSQISTRDEFWVAIDEGRITERGLWLELARRLPAPYRAAPLFLYGWASWRKGDGATAGMAAERAIAADPTYSAADLLMAVLSNGVDPKRLPKLGAANLEGELA